MLHSPHYDFNDTILPLGASYWVLLAESILSKGSCDGRAALTFTKYVAPLILAIGRRWVHRHDGGEMLSRPSPRAPRCRRSAYSWLPGAASSAACTVLIRSLFTAAISSSAVENTMTISIALSSAL